ncbi:MAG: ATP-binding protein [Anaerolineae bacterium]|nr:ATP-binding protein [Anaerolineae bacterium]
MQTPAAAQHRRGRTGSPEPGPAAGLVSREFPALSVRAGKQPVASSVGLSACYVRLTTRQNPGRFEQSRLPLRLRRQLAGLIEGGFIKEAENILIFGQPGTGKTHLAAALAYEWIHHDYSVWFTPTYKLVDGLLRAKRDYALEPELKRLDRFQVVILDDIGYVQQSREEMEVLFTFLAERYERRSVVITSNLVFSQWDQISTDPLTTAAAIDRVVHHSRIIEFGSEMTSMRAEAAARRQSQEMGQAQPGQVEQFRN